MSKRVLRNCERGFRTLLSRSGGPDAPTLTFHARERMRQRGIGGSEIRNALRNPSRVRRSRDRDRPMVATFENDVSVVVAFDVKPPTVLTVWRTSGEAPDIPAMEGEMDASTLSATVKIGKTTFSRPDGYLTLAEAAAVVGVTTGRIRQLIRAGNLPYVRAEGAAKNRPYFVHPDALAERWPESVNATADAADPDLSKVVQLEPASSLITEWHYRKPGEPLPPIPARSVYWVGKGALMSGPYLAVQMDTRTWGPDVTAVAWKPIPEDPAAPTPPVDVEAMLDDMPAHVREAFIAHFARKVA